MGDFPSGQRGQTVNLLATPSVVRIHHLPPIRTVRLNGSYFFVLYFLYLYYYRNLLLSPMCIVINLGLWSCLCNIG